MTDKGHSRKYNRLFLKVILWIARTGSPLIIPPFLIELMGRKPKFFYGLK